MVYFKRCLAGIKLTSGEYLMKKFTAALCTVLLLIGAVLVPGAAAAGPALANTRAYCIMDADTGLVLAQQNMD